MMSTRQREKLAHNRLRIYDDEAGRLRRLYADKSYALTRCWGNEDREGLVFLINRHMTSELWRQLYWLDPHLVVIDGRPYRSLCSLCMERFLCAGKANGAAFECVTQPKMLELEHD